MSDGDMDLSGLSDDQIQALFVAVFNEAARRSPTMAAAVQGRVLDELEKKRIREAAGEDADRIARAEERARIAAEARAEEMAKRAAAAAQDAAKREDKVQKILCDVILRASYAVNQPAKEISIVRLYKDGKARVLINLGKDRYMREHLADWCGGFVRVKKPLIKNRVTIASACAYADKILGEMSIKHLIGDDYI